MPKQVTKSSLLLSLQSLAEQVARPSPQIIIIITISEQEILDWAIFLLHGTVFSGVIFGTIYSATIFTELCHTGPKTLSLSFCFLVYCKEQVQSYLWFILFKSALSKINSC